MHTAFLRYLTAALSLAPLAWSAASAQSSPALFSGLLINRSVDAGAMHHPHVAGSVVEVDKCGPLNEKSAAAWHGVLSAGLGYYYADLLEDLEEWRESPWVVDTRSIGQSVEGREIWEMTITDPEGDPGGRHRITIHARTHPHEIQSWWVIEEMITFLLSDDPYAELLRETCVFHLYPMDNPDGVEANSTRYNAHGVDLEREWDKEEPEPEAAALKARFAEFMASSQPIEIALNLHSSSDPERYFWYHAASGTSEEFAQLEREYIAGVRNVFSRIMPWDYAVSWNNVAPTHFPESWFWYNFGTDVMALTYEEVFSHTLETPDADFDSAALALLHGIGDYLDLQPASVADDGRVLSGITAFTTGSGAIRLTFPTPTRLEFGLYDRLGRLVAGFGEKTWHAGEHTLAIADEIPAGLYYLYGGEGVAIPVVIR